MWIAADEHLLTNYRRSMWAIRISPICPSCVNGDETLMHVLRDCVYATLLWIKLVGSIHITNFFSLNGRDWIFKNLTNMCMEHTRKSGDLYSWRLVGIFERGGKKLFLRRTFIGILILFVSFLIWLKPLIGAIICT
jgi:hypothetical protein